MYYVLSVSDDYPDNYYFKYDHAGSPNYLSFKSARLVGDLSLQPTFRLNGKIGIDRLMEHDFFMSDGGDFISPKFAELIRAFAPNDVQLIEATVFINNKKINRFYIANILHSVACIDMKKSIYKPLIKSDPGGPKSFTRYEFIENSLESHDIVRCKEDLETIVVSEDLVQACNRAAIKGIEFLRNGVSDYE
ncbi:imm11 family protein [Pseudoduganella albidiflava]|uniref:Immunity MXAN-0049 protein domain-containing protein n=1 Tax=Pseudoduganella albidiflava TaxID=321983 RepID=A0A411WSB9_9BURK|nr:DUF1629 domain-containing protein [Pseudoduganella albidiflava]QBH99488.1 hypothetical protein EYF70_00530 [Pseudoduganella albidiflava]GGY45250.1 hypothetical protein GCM10007387_29060 [Pseudoduganella albidiflava]